MRDFLNKYKWMLLGGLVVVVVYAAANSSPNTAQPTPLPPPPTAQYQPQQQPQEDTNQQNNLSNDNYYTNSYGNTVHSPAYSNDGEVPQGARAQCFDGTYSFSQHRQGTCSHHGGVEGVLMATLVLYEGDAVTMRYGDLTPRILHALAEKYTTALCADADLYFWQVRRGSRYATLLLIAAPIRYPQPFPYPKRDRRGWVVLGEHPAWRADGAGTP